MSQLLRNARLADGRTVDVQVVDGLIASVSESTARDMRPDPVEVHDLGGWLLLPAMAEPHAHLDKALTAEIVPNPKGDLMGAINAWIAAASAGEITHDGIVERAVAAMDLLLVHGVTAVRTHVNVLESIGASAVRAIKEAAERFEGVLDVQVVACAASRSLGPRERARARHSPRRSRSGWTSSGAVRTSSPTAQVSSRSPSRPRPRRASGSICTSTRCWIPRS